MTGSALRFDVPLYVLLGASLAAATLALPAALPTALAVLAVLVTVPLAWIALRAPREEARFLLPLFLGSVAARVVTAGAIEYGLPNDYFSLDQNRYQLLGRQLAEHWAGLGPLPDLGSVRTGYYVWNALLYTLVGFVPLAVTFSNAAISGISTILAFRVARDLAGTAAARNAALLAAFFPSLVLWSSLNLKDAAAIAVILTALRGAQRLLQGERIVPILMLGGGFLVLSQLRDYLLLVIGTAVGIALLLPHLRRAGGLVTIAVGTALVIAAGGVPAPLVDMTNDASLETLERHRRNLAMGDSAYHGAADISTPVAAVRFLPIGVAYFLLAPAPWQLWNARQWMTLPEMLVWYALLPQVFFGLRHLWRRRRTAALPFVVFASLATISYALVESNLGTAYRHRAQVLVLYLIFAAVGLAVRRPTGSREASPRPRLSEALPA